MTVLFVAPCPIKGCSWKSEALPNEDHARESRRAHVSGHAHADLLLHVLAGLNGIQVFEGVEGHQ